MVRAVPVPAGVLLAVVVLAVVPGACGGAPPSSGSGASSSGASASPGAWRLSRWSRPADFETPAWGDVRPGPGLFGPDGLVLWRRAAPGSTDPGKPRKTRR